MLILPLRFLDPGGKECHCLMGQSLVEDRPLALAQAFGQDGAVRLFSTLGMIHVERAQPRSCGGEGCAEGRGLSLGECLSSRRGQDDPPARSVSPRLTERSALLRDTGGVAVQGPGAEACTHGGGSPGSSTAERVQVADPAAAPVLRSGPQRLSDSSRSSALGRAFSVADGQSSRGTRHMISNSLPSGSLA